MTDNTPSLPDTQAPSKHSARSSLSDAIVFGYPRPDAEVSQDARVATQTWVESGYDPDTNPFTTRPLGYSRPVPQLSSRSLGCRGNKEGILPISSLYEGFAYVLVGPERQKFGFHRGILCQYSFFFRAALLGNFREAEEGLVVLPDDDPSIFKIFNTWLYSRRIRGQLQNGKEVPCDAIELVKLFIFGDMRGIPALRNDVIDAFVKERSAVHLEVIPYLYANTQPSSPLRRLFVDLVNWQFEMSMGDKGVFRPDRDALAYFVPEFMMELLIAREKMKRPILMWTCPLFRIRCSYRECPLKTERCTVPYHEHPEEEGRNPRGF